MVNLLYTELLKLKRAKMLIVSMFGAAAAPIMVFIGFLDMKAKKPDTPIRIEEVFYNTNLYILLLIGTILYGVITAYLFNREHEEDTLKNLLTIPVSRIGIITSKLVLLFFWIMALTITAWLLTLGLALIGQFEGIRIPILLQTFKQFIIGGSLLFLLSTPTMFICFVFKNYVPSIIFTAVITMGNVALANREYKALNPWSAVQVIANHDVVPQYPLYYSYAAILLTAVIGFIATVVYFKKVDIH